MNSAPGLASDISSSFTWYGREDAAPQLGFLLLAHRRPRVGVDRVGAGDGVSRFAEEAQPRAVARHAGRLLHDRVRQLAWLRAGDVCTCTPSIDAAWR